MPRIRPMLLAIIATVMLATSAAGADAAGWYPVREVTVPQPMNFIIGPSYTDTAPDGTILVASSRAGGVFRLNPDGTPAGFIGQYGETPASGDGSFTSVRGVAVEPGGTVLVADFGRGDIRRFTLDGDFVETVVPGGSGSAPGQFNGVVGIDVDASGNIYAADDGNARVQKFSPDGTYLGELGTGTPGAGAGQLDTPRDVAVLTDGSVAVADFQNKRIALFDATGTFVRNIGGLNFTRGVAAAADGSILVASTYQNSVKRFATDGTLLATGGSTGSGVGQLARPTDVTEGLDGRVFIADANNDRVQAFAANLATATVVTDDGRGSGSVLDPTDVAVLANGDLLVADSGNGRVERLDSDGTALGTFVTVSAPRAVEVLPSGNVAITSGHFVRLYDATGTFIGQAGGTAPGPGQMTTAMGVSGAGDGSIWVASTSSPAALNHYSSALAFLGTSTGAAFAGAAGVDVAPDGSISVADKSAGLVHRLDDAGDPIGDLDGTGTYDLQAPHGIDAASDGTIWVGDATANDVKHFATDGTELDVIGGLGADLDEFTAPMGVETDGDSVLVVDSGNNRVVRWRPDTTPPTASATPSISGTTATIHVTASDAESGLADAPYSFDGGATWTSTATHALAGLTPGTTVRVDVRVRDRTDNVASLPTDVEIAATTTTTTTTTTVVDTTPPTLDLPRRGRTNGLRWRGPFLAFTVSDDTDSAPAVTAFVDGRERACRDGEIDLRSTASGIHRLVLEATDSSGNATRLRRTILVDHSAPTFRSARSNPALGASYTAAVVDRWTRPTRSTVRVTRLHVGRNVRRVRLVDVRGNAAVRTIVVQAYPSLSRPEHNRGLVGAESFTRTRLDRELRFNQYAFPWYTASAVPGGPHARPIVSEIQRRLKLLGMLPIAHATGSLDFATVRAVQRFQSRHAIPELGTVGPRTRRALDAAIA